MNNIPPQFPKYFWYCKIFCRRLYQFAFKIFWRWYNKCDTLLHQSGHWRLVKIILRLLDPNPRPTSCYPRWESRTSEWAELQLSPVKRFPLNLNEYAQGHMLSICTTISFKIIAQTLRIFTQWLRKKSFQLITPGGEWEALCTEAGYPIHHLRPTRWPKKRSP